MLITNYLISGLQLRVKSLTANSLQSNVALARVENTGTLIKGMMMDFVKTVISTTIQVYTI